MNILVLIIYILTAIIFLWSGIILVKMKKQKDLVGLYAQFFMVTITAFIFSILGIYQQFISGSLVGVINQFVGIFFIIASINFIVVVGMIWNINNGRKIEAGKSATLTIFILFIEFIILGSSWTAFYFYQKSGDIVLNQYKDYLYAIANSRASHISTLVLDYKNKILADSTINLGLINCLEALESNNGNCTKGQLDEIVKGRLESKIYATYFIAILDKSGKVIISTDNSLVGEDWSSKPAFINRTDEGYVSNIFYDENYNRQGIEISHPIVKNGNFLGVWIVRENPDSIYNVLQDRTNLGNTGEAILIDANESILSPQRFTDEMFIKTDSPNAAGCKDDFDNYVVETPTSLTVDKHNFSIAEYINKFGRSILGAHVVVEGPTKGLKWCVLVEIGKEEALSNFNKDLSEAAIFSLIIIIALACIFIFTFDLFFKKLFKNSSN